MRIYFEKGSIEVTVLQNSEGNYEYYIGNMKIGLYNPNVMKDEKIVIRSKTLKDEIANQIKDTIDGMDRSEIEKESQETKKIYTYMKELGQREEEKTKIVKIDLKEQEENKDNEEKKGDKEKQEEEEEAKQKVKKATTKDVNIKQEIEVNERANDMKDIGQWLGGKLPKDIQKIGVIESTDMNKMQDENGKSYQNGSTRYSLIAINKKGEVEPLSKYIPQLKQRDTSGNNPTEKKVQVRADGHVEKNAVLSEYEIGEKVIQIDNKEMGRVEMNIGQEEHGGNDTLTIQAIDDNTYPKTKTGILETIGEHRSNGVYGVNGGLKEVEKHNKNEQHLDHRDVDGDPNTQSHDHFEEMAKEILKENEEISEVYNQNDVIETLKKLAEKDPEKNFEELKAGAQEYLEEQAKNEHIIQGNRTMHQK